MQNTYVNTDMIVTIKVNDLIESRHNYVASEDKFYYQKIKDEDGYYYVWVDEKLNNNGGLCYERIGNKLYINPNVELTMLDKTVHIVSFKDFINANTFANSLSMQKIMLLQSF